MDKNTKIAVLGLGPSLMRYIPEDYDLSIGVNDIYKHHPVDVIVCVDKRDRFNDERMKTIDESTPEAFFSHLEDYQDRPDFIKIELQPYFPDHICQINIPQYPKSMCSPFVACAVAYKVFHANEIHLFGVDMLDHPHLNGSTCSKIKVHFKNLLIALRQSGSDLIIHGDGILRNLHSTN